MKRGRDQAPKPSTEQPMESVNSIPTPALIVDLDALEWNLQQMGSLLAEYPNISIRPHAKTHKCAEIALMQQNFFGKRFSGVCCQTVNEVEFMVNGGVTSVLLSNEIYCEEKIRTMVKLAKMPDTSIIVCVDSAELIARYSKEASRLGANLEVLVEVNVGSNRCGVETVEEALALAQLVTDAPGLQFSGLQAYNGHAQHIRALEDRKAAIEMTSQKAKSVVDALLKVGIPCPMVTGGGTGTFLFEAGSQVFTEIQVGSFIYNDVDYSKNIGGFPWKQSLFVVGQVISRSEAAKRVVIDAGQKAVSVDSGLPKPHLPSYREYKNGGDEHGIIFFDSVLEMPKLGAKIWLHPGHCDPTVNMHDFLYVVRGEAVVHEWRICPRS